MEDIKLGAKSFTFGLVAVIHGILAILLLILFPVTKGNAKILVGVIISIFSIIIIIFGLAALIKGIKNFINSKKDKNITHNKSLSAAGIILGIISLLKGLIIIFIFIITTIFIIYINKYNSVKKEKIEQEYKFSKNSNMNKTIYFYEITSPIRSGLKDGKTLQIKLSLIYTNKETENEIIKKEKNIKEILINYFSSKNSDEIIFDETMKKIEFEIIKLINKELDTGKIIKIYILEYTVM